MIRSGFVAFPHRRLCPPRYFSCSRRVNMNEVSADQFVAQIKFTDAPYCNSGSFILSVPLLLPVTRNWSGTLLTVGTTVLACASVALRAFNDASRDIPYNLPCIWTNAANAIESCNATNNDMVIRANREANRPVLMAYKSKRLMICSILLIPLRHL